MNACTIRHRTQTGAILVVSLILLTVMTLIGITAMQTTILQEKMAGNSRDWNLAFEAAEAGNRKGENWLSGRTAMPAPCISNSLSCTWNAANGATALFSATQATSYIDHALWQNARNYDDPNLWPSGTPVPLAGVATPPKFVVEFTGHQRDSQNLGQQQDLSNSRSLYRITARGTGGTDTAEAFVQTNFAKRF